MFLIRKERNTNPIFIAIGANLPDGAGRSPLQICESAATDICTLPGLGSCVRSRWFSSAPIPLSDQPRYINGVIRTEGKIDPDALLFALQAIETKAGRVRSVTNAARTLDLDIIDMAGLVRAAPDPILPHPRAHERAFVLFPLRDVAPDWVHPQSLLTLKELLGLLPPQDISPL
jgi:2-amino-4-hydroxy-6-hydroxymethyldihydropteridine diphosphokinase